MENTATESQEVESQTAANVEENVAPSFFDTESNFVLEATKTDSLAAEIVPTSATAESLVNQEEISAIDQPLKPWYLSTKHIYALVKNAVASVPYSQTVFDNTLLAICTTTTYINKSTKLNVVVEPEDCHNLAQSLDETVKSLTVRADDGFDALRAKLSQSLNDLLTAVVAHKTWAEDLAAKKVGEAGETSVVVVEKMKSTYDRTLELIRSALALAKDSVYAHAADVRVRVEDKVKTTVGAVQTAAGEVKEETESRLLSAITSALNIAQPYVQSAVNISTPYVARAVEISSPYVAQASPYLEPLVAKVTAVNASLLESERFGSFVSQAEDAAQKALVNAKEYCTPAAVPAAATAGVAPEEITTTTVVSA